MFKAREGKNQEMWIKKPRQNIQFFLTGSKNERGLSWQSSG